MKNTGKTISEITNKTKQDKMLLLQNFKDKNLNNKDINSFIDYILSLHIDNKDNIKFAQMQVSVGKFVTKRNFVSVLTSNVSDPIVRVSSWEQREPQFIIQDNHTTIFVVNLTDISVKYTEVEYCEDGFSIAHFGLHSFENKLDYSINITMEMGDNK